MQTITLTPVINPTPQTSWVNEVKKQLLSKIKIYNLPVSEPEKLDNQELSTIISLDQFK